MNSYMLLVCIVWFLVWKIIEAAVGSICCAVCYKVTWMKWDQCSRLGVWAKCRVTVHLGKPQAPKSGHDQHLKFWSHETNVKSLFSFCFSPYFSLFHSCPFRRFLSLSLLPRTSQMMTPGWSTMWMQTMASPWRVISLRGPAMLLRHGIGTEDSVNKLLMIKLNF